MTPFEEFLESLITVNPLSIVKAGTLIFLALYIAFAVAVVRQVKLMIKVLNGTFELPLQVIALAHLTLAVLVFLIALTTL